MTESRGGNLKLAHVLDDLCRLLHNTILCGCVLGLTGILGAVASSLIYQRRNCVLLSGSVSKSKQLTGSMRTFTESTTPNCHQPPSRVLPGRVCSQSFCVLLLITQKRFSLRRVPVFEHCPILRPYLVDHSIEEILASFTHYKTRVPVCGAILLNSTLDKCLLVKGWHSRSSWGFPKGKINKDEPEIECARREVMLSLL